MKKVTVFTQHVFLVLSLILFVFGLTPLKAQKDWNWWNETHNWKPGMPSWKYYIKVSPGYLGPNALPVPEHTQALIEEKIQLTSSITSHFSAGDNTQDISFRFYYPFASGKIALELYGVAFEHYKMTPKIRDERAARDFDGKGTLIGDFYFATHIQLIKDKSFPDLAVRLAGKTASGGGYDAARYSDSPGYFFDFSMGKNFLQKNDANWRWYNMLGFYSWQTSSDEVLQNDAWVYGAGLSRKTNKSEYNVELAGYIGYKDQRDRPMVARLKWQKQIGKNKLSIGLQQGLNHFQYTSVRIGWSWQWDKKEE